MLSVFRQRGAFKDVVYADVVYAVIVNRAPIVVLAAASVLPPVKYWDGKLARLAKSTRAGREYVP